MKKKTYSDFDSQKKRGFKRVFFYIFSSFVVLLLLLVLSTLLLTKKTNEPPAVFGYRLFIVTTSSMKDHIPVGSAIIVQQHNAKTLQIDDIITFKEGYDNDNNLIINTHRIVSSVATESGPSFITKGDSNQVEDAKRRYTDDIYGKVIVIMPGIGKFLIFIKSPIGLLTCIAFPLLLLLIFEIFNLLRISKEPQKTNARKAKETQANLFGTHTNHPTQFKSADRSNRPARAINTTLYNTKEFRAKHTPVLNTNYVDENNSTSSIEKEPRKITEGRIVTKQEESDEILNNMNSFAFIRSKTIRNRNKNAQMEVIDQFSNGKNDLAIMATKANAEFSAMVQSHGTDRFNIDGIEVSVQPDSINLGFDENNQGRDISITITNHYTNVVIDSKDYEINFALFKDKDDEEQKATIQKINK